MEIKFFWFLGGTRLWMANPMKNSIIPTKHEISTKISSCNSYRFQSLKKRFNCKHTRASVQTMILNDRIFKI